MTYGQVGAVCPQCGSAAAVHSVDELAAMARSPARAVRAGVPAAAGIPGAAAGIPAAGVSLAAASVVGLSLAVAVVGVPLGAAVVRFPCATASTATATGLFGLGAAAGIHRPAASQPVVKRQLEEQFAEQQ